MTINNFMGAAIKGHEVKISQFAEYQLSLMVAHLLFKQLQMSQESMELFVITVSWDEVKEDKN